MKYLNDISETEFIEAVKKSYSKTDICKNLGYNFFNGSIGRDVNELLKLFDCDISHFQRGIKNIKNKRFEKTCPVCQKKFQSNEKYDKVTCGHSCANTYFRSGKNNPNWKESVYRSTCFQYHEKKCIICGEENIVEVHHFDEDHHNNNPENLIPICPTHHRYFHSSYRSLVQDKIEEWRQSYISMTDSLTG